MSDRSVLIVEDQMMLAVTLARKVAATGVTVVGPFLTAEAALSSIADKTPSAAILDIDLGHGNTSEPIAESLMGLDVPFVFLTGYSQTHPVIEKFPPVAYRAKPVDNEDVNAIMTAFFPT